MDTPDRWDGGKVESSTMSQTRQNNGPQRVRTLRAAAHRERMYSQSTRAHTNQHRVSDGQAGQLGLPLSWEHPSNIAVGRNTAGTSTNAPLDKHAV